jgi:hypothetical protein
MKDRCVEIRQNLKIFLICIFFARCKNVVCIILLENNSAIYKKQAFIEKLHLQNLR